MKSFKKSTVCIAISAAIIATASFAASHTSKSSNPAVAARHAQMQVIAYSIGILGGMAKGEIEFNAEMASSAATNMNKLAALDAASLWLEGTAQGDVDGSRAKAEIWTDMAGFAGKFDQLEVASAALMGATSVDDVRAGMGAIGGACKACHEGYRGPKN